MSTLSTLPSYREPNCSSQNHQDTSTTSRSAAFSSNSSSSDIGPDMNPVTSQMMMADPGMEVYIPEKIRAASSTSLSTTLQASRSYHEYNFCYTNAVTHSIITDLDQQALFFAEISPFAKGMADVCLRDIGGGGFDDLVQKGPSLGMKEAQDVSVVATADAMPNSKHIKLGLGDPLQQETNRWIVMRHVHDDPESKTR